MRRSIAFFAVLLALVTVLAAACGGGAVGTLGSPITGASPAATATFAGHVLHLEPTRTPLPVPTAAPTATLTPLPIVVVELTPTASPTSTPAPHGRAWQGTLDYSTVLTAPTAHYDHEAHMTLTLQEDAAGNVTGTAEATLTYTAAGSSGCGQSTETQDVLQATLTVTGRGTPAAMVLKLSSSTPLTTQLTMASEQCGTFVVPYPFWSFLEDTSTFIPGWPPALQPAGAGYSVDATLSSPSAGTTTVNHTHIVLVPDDGATPPP